jgi:small subunit ribosomal protein S17
MEKRPLRKTRIGYVVSNKMQKSILVAIESKVKIMETRPLSLRKKWRLVEILEKAK